MLNFNQQQRPPGMFPAVDELETRVHPVTPFVLAGVCGVGGYFFGAAQDNGVPVAIYAAVGLVVGLLLVPLLLKLLSGALAAIIVLAAALAMWLLLQNDAAIRHRQPPPRQSAPAATPAYGEATRELVRRALQEVQ